MKFLLIKHVQASLLILKSHVNSILCLPNAPWLGPVIHLSSESQRIQFSSKYIWVTILYFLDNSNFLNIIHTFITEKHAVHLTKSYLCWRRSGLLSCTPTDLSAIKFHGFTSNFQHWMHSSFIHKWGLELILWVTGLRYEPWTPIYPVYPLYSSKWLKSSTVDRLTQSLKIKQRKKFCPPKILGSWKNRS